MNLSSPDRRDALLRAPTLDLTLSPLPGVPDGKKQEDESEEEKSDIEEEERPKDWADQVEEEEKSSDVKEKKVFPLEESIEALEDFARGIIKCFTKLPEVKCCLCEEGEEDFKYSPIRRKDQVAALEALALRMMEWRRPGGPRKRRKYKEGYDSLVMERRYAMELHGLDVKHQ